MQAKSFKENLIVALDENLFAAKKCLEFEKDKKWANYESRDILGFPAVILLLIIVDTIGGFLNNKKGWNHFMMLNDNIFGNQNISIEEAKDIYSAFRDPLIHNSILLRGLHYSAEGGVFLKKDGKIISINLKKLYDICEKSVELFKQRIGEKNILNKLSYSIQKLYNQFDRQSLPPGIDSNIATQIALTATPVSGAIYNVNKLKK